MTRTSPRTPFPFLVPESRQRPGDDPIFSLNAEAMRGKLHAFLQARVPTGGPGTVHDVARLVAMLFTEDIPYLTGETIYLDGGQGMAH